LDGPPFVVPEARHRSSFVVAFSHQAGLKEIVGKDACLGQTITPLADFEVNPPIRIPIGDIVFLDKFLRYVSNFYSDIFWVRHRCIKVEVLEVDRAEACTMPRQDAVEQELDKFELCYVGANVAWVAYSIAPNSDAGAIGVLFLRAYFTNYHGVADFPLFVCRYVLIND
jgi:hypothetical protein